MILHWVQLELGQYKQEVSDFVVDNHNILIHLDHQLSPNFRIPFHSIEELCQTKQYNYCISKSCCSEGLSWQDEDYIDEKYFNASDEDIEIALNKTFNIF